MRKSKRDEQIRKSAELYDGLQTYYPWIIRALSGTTGNGHHGVFVVCRAEAPNDSLHALLRDSAYVTRNPRMAHLVQWWLNKRAGY